MAYRLKIFSAVLFGTVAFLPVSSIAADIDDVVYADDANFVQPAELGSSWYLRGDVGINLNGTQNVDSSGDPARTTLYDNNITDGYNFSVGVGKRINGFLRLEGNVGRLAGADFSASSLMRETTDPLEADPDNLLVGPNEAIACNGRGVFVDPILGDVVRDTFIENCVDVDSAEYDTTFGMLNAYVDLPKMYGFQPFIGGGVGVGRVSWRQEVNAVECTPDDESVTPEGCRAYGVPDQPDFNEPYRQPGEISEGVGYRLGYQVGAGVAYDVSDNLTLDTTYKYSYFGGGQFSGSDGASLATEGFSVHQVNVGLRYSFF